MEKLEQLKKNVLDAVEAYERFEPKIDNDDEKLKKLEQNIRDANSAYLKEYLNKIKNNITHKSLMNQLMFNY
jgi:hypothetical protein